jgi:hypothetical protein
VVVAPEAETLLGDWRITVADVAVVLRVARKAVDAK